jgi:phosphodiester glycosidase
VRAESPRFSIVAPGIGHATFKGRSADAEPFSGHAFKIDLDEAELRAVDDGRVMASSKRRNWGAGDPRLLVGGKVPQLKPQIAERTAVCADGHVVVLVVSSKAEATAFARFLADPPDKGGRGCWDALNLDGARQPSSW